MQILWESSDWPGAVVDPAITCLSWLALDDCDQGLLGAGSQSGSIGVTRTSITPNTAPVPDDIRLNCNLRGHHAPIALASWNQPQKKLATCDDGGIIYVWMPYEERWSVELVNDRGIKVSDFCWSPSGSFALICYHDDFVLIGSASGQRIWSNVYLTSILCGTWSPDSTKVVLGTADGHLHYLTDQGVHIAEYTVNEAKPIQKMCWFKICGGEDNLLCLCFSAGIIYLMKSCDDPDPIVLNTQLNIVSIRSNPEGDSIAIVGTCVRNPSVSRLQIYRTDSTVLYSNVIPFANGEPVSSFTWAHGSQSLIFSAGGEICVGRVVSIVPPLQLLCSHKVWKGLGLNATSKNALDSLPIPPRYRSMIALHNYHIIQCRVPREEDLCESVCKPSSWQWYCSIKPVPRHTQVFTLCVEHLGGLVPVLVARQIHKLLPEFEIRYCQKFGKEFMTSRSRSSTPEVTATVQDSNEASEPPPSPFQRGGLQRDSVWRRSKRQIQSMVQRAQQHAHSSLSSQIKKEDKLAQVCSNMWCTRFKLIGMTPKLLPPYLGQVMYKTSVLHLQPRQMTVQVVNLDASPNSIPILPPSDSDLADCADENLLMQQDEGPPIAPLHSEIFIDQDAPERTRQLLNNEEDLLKKVLGEFNDLRSAVDGHIARMREFASELQQSSRQLQRQPVPPNLGPSCTPAMRLLESVARFESSPQFQSNPSTSIAEECEISSLSLDRSEPACSEPLPAVRRTWTELVEELDFIDEDESLVVTSECEKRRLRARALSYSTPPASMQHTQKPSKPVLASSSKSATTSPARSKLYSTNPWKFSKKSTTPRRSMSEQEGGQAFRPIVSSTHNRELKEISSVLDKLSRLANDLTSRQGVIDRAGGLQGGDKVCPHQPIAISAETAEPGPYTRWRNTITEIAGRVNQLERRVNHGNELLDEVRGDLQARVNRIRVVLGDANSDPEKQASSKETEAGKETTAEEAGGVLTLHNKTPFWNEASQVYQLDFGGRITQESAKNFQIEYQDKQVMQFGRIENGCYTLDFQSPFCAVQAFAVALASITQRLK